MTEKRTPQEAYRIDRLLLIPRISGDQHVVHNSDLTPLVDPNSLAGFLYRLFI
jgi:hypothetical protein